MIQFRFSNFKFFGFRFSGGAGFFDIENDQTELIYIYIYIYIYIELVAYWYAKCVLAN